HASRGGSAGCAFAAGVIASVTVMGGYVLGVVTSDNDMDDARWVFVLQLGTLGAAAWAGASLASRRWVLAWRERLENRLAGPLIGVQLGLTTIGNLALLLLVLAATAIVPEQPLSAGQAEVGERAGWLARA